MPPGLNVDDGVSETEGEALSLWNNAAFNETLSELGFTRLRTLIGIDRLWQFTFEPPKLGPLAQTDELERWALFQVWQGTLTLTPRLLKV